MRRTLLLTTLAFAVSTGGSAAAAQTAALELLGVVTFETGVTVDGAELGGISALACAPGGQDCWALADDRREPRLFRLSLDLADGRLDPGDIQFASTLWLTEADGEPLTPGTADPEGLVLMGDGSFLVASEGDSRAGIAPFVARFDPAGRRLETLPLPAAYLPSADLRRGVRNNLGFESLTLTPSGRFLVTATENALAQDGPASDLGVGTPSRLLLFDAASGAPLSEFFYWVDAVDSVAGEGQFRVAGLCDLLALSDDRFLSIERTYAAGIGNRIRIYDADLRHADPLPAGSEALDPATLRPIEKRLILDLDSLGIVLDNLEALAFGPRLADGRATLLVAGDNNFSASQVTQFLAFAIDVEPEIGPALATATIAEIQGAGHRSPLAGRRVEEVRGVVTAISRSRRSPGFWMESREGDGDVATSEGLWVPGEAPTVTVGDEVAVRGQVAELGDPDRLSVTSLTGASIRGLGTAEALPPPAVIGAGGRSVPRRVIDDDALTLFEPDRDGADFWESLEGMRVELDSPPVVGPTSRFGSLVVLAGEERSDLVRTTAGGLLRRDDEPHPERLEVAFASAEPVVAAVGDRFEGPLRGVVGYAFGTYSLLAEEPPTLVRSPLPTEATPLRGGPDHLTVATYNVLNLSAVDPTSKFERLAHTLVAAVGSPDIVALQEIQDDSGPEDDGVTSAEATLTRLVTAVEAAGGPRYAFRQLDPPDGADGGRPGANIRVAFLFDPRRVDFVDRGAAGDRPAVVTRDDGLHLTASPARLGEDDPAFADNPRLGFGGTRKPLVAEMEFNGHRLFLIDLHLSSKGGDDGLFGAHQPPLAVSEVQRRDQAAVVHGFVEEIVAADPTARVIVLGDFNEHEFRPPLSRLAGRILVNLMLDVPEPERYSYVYRGNAQLLDHILVSTMLTATARPEIDAVHVNADRPHGEAASDHDPIVARFYLPRR